MSISRRRATVNFSCGTVKDWLMDFNFDEIIPRRNTRSYKWDSAPAGDVLPLWVADMDFRTAPAVIEALERRVRHGIFGYVRVPDEYYEAVIRWFERRHGWRFERDWMIYTSGVVPAVSAVIKALTEPGDGIVVQTPVYNCFFSSIRNNGCRIVTNPLKYEDQTYHIDYEDLERKTADPSVKLLLFCNPHNPAGRVWTREELRRVGDICLRNHVMIISDEIHCELVFPGYTYTPFASLGDSYLRNTITCVSPSKSFNLAGLQIANIIACDKTIRERIDRAININEVCDVIPFGVEATIAAYNEGEEWLMRLLDYLKANYEDMNEFFRKYLPRIPVTKLEGTYLVWTDCRALSTPSETLGSRLLTETGLWLNSGTMYGAEGEGFLRWNIACPRSVLRDALTRFRRFVENQAQFYD